MQVQSVSGQNFRGLQYYPNYGEVLYLIAANTGGCSFDKATNIMRSLAKNKTTTALCVGGDLQNPRLFAEVGGKLFKENIIRGPVSVLKKALKLSNKLDKQECK